MKSATFSRKPIDDVLSGVAPVFAMVHEAELMTGGPLPREDHDVPVDAVITEERWFQGADRHLEEARAAVSLPCLRKDFMLDPWQVAESRALGADAILVILALVDDSLAAELIAEATRLGMKALVEVHDETEMARACALDARLVGINNRSLRSFDVNLETTEWLALLKPANALLVSESGIFTPADVARVEDRTNVVHLYDARTENGGPHCRVNPPVPSMHTPSRYAMTVELPPRWQVMSRMPFASRSRSSGIRPLT